MLGKRKWSQTAGLNGTDEFKVGKVLVLDAYWVASDGALWCCLCKSFAWLEYSVVVQRWAMLVPLLGSTKCRAELKACRGLSRK